MGDLGVLKLSSGEGGLLLSTPHVREDPLRALGWLAGSGLPWGGGGAVWETRTGQAPVRPACPTPGQHPQPTDASFSIFSRRVFCELLP